MKKFTFVSAIFLILGMALCFNSCEKEKKFKDTIYKGTVINSVTSKSFPNLVVKITNGLHVKAEERTKEDGTFSITAQYSEVNGDYFVLIGDASCVPVKRELTGLGMETEVNYGEIIVEGPQVPVVSTTQVTNITAKTATSGGNVTSNGRSEVTQRGVCWSKNVDPTIKDSHTTDGAGSGEFQSEITGLEYGNTYYVRAYAVNSVGISYGVSVAFTTILGQPVVRTNDASNVLAKSATCSGEIISDSGYAISACGVCWSSVNQLPTIAETHTTETVKSGVFSSEIASLEPNTKYYVRAYATNENGTTYGTTVTFTTPDGLPSVETGAVTNVFAQSATCSGEIITDSGYAISACGFCWSSVNQMPTIEGSHTAETVTLGAFSSEITSLEPNTKYYIRAYATNENGTTYGTTATFTTPNGLPSVATGSVANVLPTSATCSGSVSDDAGYDITAQGVCWSSEKESPTIEDNHTTEAVSQSNFTSEMKNLKANTRYYVRAYATNANGTSYGSSKTFVTTEGLATVVTGTVTNIQPTSATCSGSVLSDAGYSVVAQGLCWSSETVTPTIANDHTTESAAQKDFTSEMTELKVNTTYYVRAYATNSNGTSYGSTATFTTPDGLPRVTTTEIGDNITKTTITTGGNITSDGGFPVIARGVVWGTQQNPTVENNDHTTDGYGTGSFSSQITGVNTSAETYYIRSYATNKIGTSYGEQIVITPEYLQYVNLKTFQYEGRTYKVYLDLGVASSADEARVICENLTFNGYSDWVLPTDSEGAAILRAYGVYGTQYFFEGICSFWIEEGRRWTTHWYGDCWPWNSTYYCLCDVLSVIAIRKY